MQERRRNAAFTHVKILSTVHLSLVLLLLKYWQQILQHMLNITEKVVDMSHVWTSFESTQDNQQTDDVSCILCLMAKCFGEAIFLS